MAAWTPPPIPPDLVSATDTPLVGRQHELQILDDVWDAVLSGRRRALFIGGEPGAGKTRLAAEAGVVLEREGAVVLLGRSVAEFGIPYDPFVQALEQLLGGTEPGSLEDVIPDSAAGLTVLTPLVARHRPSLEQGKSTESDYRREMFDAYADLFTAVSQQRPVVLILEDLHWARAPSLQLLSHLAKATAQTRLLIVATMRTTAPDRSDDLTYAIADMYRLDGVQRIDLGGLDVADIADYVTNELGASPTEAQSSAAVLRDRTGGNPFFLRELLQDLARAGGVRALHSSGFRAPESVRDTLKLRLATFDPADLEVIELAAFIGDPFDLATLLMTSDAGSETTLEAIDRAAEAGLVHPESSGDDAYSFVHALARQAVIDLVAPSRRGQTHARIAQALEKRAVHTNDLIAQLAHHYAAAAPFGFDTEAVKYLVQAAEISDRSLAYEEAAAGFARAALLAGADRERLLLAAARSHVRAGEFGEAREIYQALATSERPEVGLSAAIGYEDASWRPGRVGHKAVELLTDALGSYPADESDPSYVQGLASLGRALAFTGANDEAQRIGEQSIALAQTIGDPELLARSLQASLWHVLVPERADTQLERAREVTYIAAAARDYVLLGPAAFHRAAIAYLQGRRGEWIAALADLRRAARTTGEKFLEYMVGCIDASQQYIRGDYAGARSAIDALVAVGGTFGQDDTEGSYGLQVFMVQSATGGLEQVRPLISGEESIESHWAPGLLALYTELGLKQPAAKALESLMDTSLEPDLQPTQWPAIAAFLVDAAMMLDDQTAARRLFPVLERYQGCNLLAGQFVAVFGSADRYLARLASLLGDDSAEALFESALDMDTRMGSLTHQAETLAAYAVFLKTRPDRPSQDRAREFREEALRIANANGQRRILTILNETLELPAGLTLRELDVIRLVAEGLSNKEVGERLHISPNTAANHVRSILTKTGSQNRTRAAIYAAQNNLLE